MKIIIKFICLFFILTVACHASPLPKEFIYKGKAIDPLCFSEHAIISLDKCGINAQPGRYISGQETVLTQKGFTGYDYKTSDTGPIQAYSYYKIIGKTGNAYIIYQLNSTGGSGEFSTLALATRKRNLLQIRILSTGDRCNHGLRDATLTKQNTLTYEMNITPFDYFELANINPGNLKPYTDFDDCAACCTGFAVFSSDVSSHFNDKKLLYVDFNNYPTDTTSTSNASHQICFNKLVKEYKANNQVRLDKTKLREFIQKFNTLCKPN